MYFSLGVITTKDGSSLGGVSSVGDLEFLRNWIPLAGGGLPFFRRRGGPSTSHFYYNALVVILIHNYFFCSRGAPGSLRPSLTWPRPTRDLRWALYLGGSGSLTFAPNPDQRHRSHRAPRYLLTRPLPSSLVSSLLELIDPCTRRPSRDITQPSPRPHAGSPARNLPRRAACSLVLQASSYWPPPRGSGETETPAPQGRATEWSDPWVRRDNVVRPQCPFTAAGDPLGRARQRRPPRARWSH